MEPELSLSLVVREEPPSWYRRLLCCYPPVETSRLAVQQLTDLPSPSAYTEEVRPQLHYPVLDYAAERVYLAGRGPSKVFILIHHTNLAEDQTPRPVEGKHASSEQLPKSLWLKRLELFSKFDEGVKVDVGSWTECVMERIAKCISKRCKNVKVLDAFCGVGGTAIQLARHCQVSALDLDPVKVEYAKHNANVYGVAEKMTFLQGDFLALSSQLRADVVFLDLPRSQANGSLCEIFASPPLLSVIEQAQHCAPTILLYLPKEVNIDEVAELVKDSTDFECAVELEVYHHSGDVQGVCAVIGAAASLPQKDILRLVASRLSIQNSKETNLLESVIAIAGLRKTVDLLSSLEAQRSVVSSRSSLDEHGVSKANAFFALAEDDPEVAWESIMRKSSEESEAPTLPRSLPGRDIIIRLHRVEGGDETAEVLKLLFTYQGLRFVDHKVVLSKYDPARLQELSEFGIFPVCDFGDKKLMQTRPAARYIAQTFGLYPEDKVQVYLVESLCDYVQDAHQDLQSTENRAEAAKAVIRRLAKRLGKWTGPRPLLQDFYVAWLVQRWRSDLSELPLALRRSVESVGK